MHAPDATRDSPAPRSRLDTLGWSAWFDVRFREHGASGLVAGRVVADHGHAYTVALDGRDLTASVTGRLAHALGTTASRPAIGDWVAVRVTSDHGAGSIATVLERRSTLSRKRAAAVTEEQVIAANVDLVFIVAALSEAPNLRRLERYLTIAWDSGAAPVIVLTKADLTDDPDAARDDVDAIAPDIPVAVVSNLTGSGLAAVGEHLAPGVTGVLVGPSGVGKSSLINRLLGREQLPAQAVRRDGRGRHTTTNRQLLLLPSGGMIIDTPGLRELQLWADDEALERTFEDIGRLAAGCRYRDCRHDREPGCAVKAAILEGTLPGERLSSYRKLERELRALAMRTDVRLAQEERRKWRAIRKEVRHRTRPA